MVYTHEPPHDMSHDAARQSDDVLRPRYPSWSALRQELLPVAVAVYGAGLVAPMAAPTQWCAAESGIAPAWIRAVGKEMPDAVGSPAVRGLV